MVASKLDKGSRSPTLRCLILNPGDLSPHPCTRVQATAVYYRYVRACGRKDENAKLGVPGHLGLWTTSVTEYSHK
eukprot:6986225-Prymnesium_polylepis.1